MEDKYITAIKQADLSKASIKQYTSKLQSLVDITKHDIDWIIEHPKETKDIVYRTYDAQQTRKAHLVAILVLFKYVKDLKCNKKEQYDLFYKFHQETNNLVKEKYRSGKPSEKQLEAYVDWNDVIKKREQLAKDNYASREHLILAMYSHIPPLRQDFYNVKLLPKMPFGSKANQGNFLVIKARSPCVLVLNEFKTDTTFKRYYKEMPPELCKIIHKSLLEYPRDYLFVDSQNKPYDKFDSFCKLINRSLQDIFEKPVTVTMLRHSFIIDERKRNVSPGEEEDTARDMLHSVEMKNLYRFTPPS